MCWAILFQKSYKPLFSDQRKALFSDLHIYKNDTMPNIVMCHAWVCACISYRHLPSCSIVPHAVRLIVITSCGVTRCLEKPSLTWLGFDPLS